MSFEEVYQNFGGDANVFVRNNNWVALVRPKQVTLGASVLMPTRSMLSLSELNDNELIAFGNATRQLEATLKKPKAPDLQAFVDDAQIIRLIHSALVDA